MKKGQAQPQGPNIGNLMIVLTSCEMENPLSQSQMEK